jgi:hypothetical protein
MRLIMNELTRYAASGVIFLKLSIELLAASYPTFFSCSVAFQFQCDTTVIWYKLSLHASVMLVVPSDGYDDGAVMRMINPGVAASAARSPDTSAEREAGVSKLLLLIKRDARARLEPTT